MENEKDLWQQTYSQLDALIVAGKLEECRKILNSQNPKKLPRSWAPAFGELAFRVKLPMYALKALHRYIYPENSLTAKATNKEQMIYATALFGLGAINESRILLRTIDPLEEPEALFYGAVVNFFDWNYTASIPFLQEYILSSKITPYRRLVGKVNLVAALVFTQDWPRVAELIAEIQAECASQSYLLLLGNSYELLGQLEFYQANYDQALIHFEKAKTLLDEQGGHYSFYVNKWIAISQCLKTPSEENLLALRRIREEADKLGNWNTLRECDLFEAVATKDQKLIRKVIMGNPFESYRQRARNLFGENLNANGRYHLHLKPTEASTDQLLIFDPYKNGLHQKPLLLNLFDSLTQDFYQPCNIGALFQRIYPKEKFNPFTSPPRVLQLLRRLNHWLEENGGPLRVSFKKSEFSIMALESIFVVIQRGKKMSPFEGKLLELKDHFPDRSFTTAKVAEAMAISKVSAQKLLRQALIEGKLIKDGRKQFLSYRFAPRRHKSKGA